MPYSAIWLVSLAGSQKRLDTMSRNNSHMMNHIQIHK